MLFWEGRVLSKDIENFGYPSVGHALLRTDYVPEDTHEGLVVTVSSWEYHVPARDVSQSGCPSVGNPFVGGLFRLP